MTTEINVEDTSVSVSPPALVTVVPEVYLANADARKDMAMRYTMGAGIAMTVLASVAMYVDRGHADYVFWLGLAAMSIIAIIFTGILGLLVKRSIQLSKEGLVITDANYKP